MQAHPARVNQHQHGGGLFNHRPAQQADQLGAMNLAHRAAHELALLGGDQHRPGGEQGASDDDAVIKGAGQAEHFQMGAGARLGGRQKFAKTRRVDQAGNAAAGGGLEPAAARGRHPRPSP